MARNLEVDLLKTLKKELRNALGGCGSILIDDTSNHAGNWYAIIAQEQTELDVSGCTVDIEDFPSSTTDIIIGAGVVLYGNWSAIELNSGSVLALETC